MYKSVTVTHKGKLYPMVSKDEATRRLKTEEKGQEILSVTNLGMLMFLQVFSPISICTDTSVFEAMSTKSIFSHEIKGKRLFFKKSIKAERKLK